MTNDLIILNLLLVDSSSYISTKITNIEVIVYYLITEAQIASGTMSSLSIPLQKITNGSSCLPRLPLFFFHHTNSLPPYIVNFPLKFTGTYTNYTDPTYIAIRSACNTGYVETPRTDLSLSMAIFYNVQGVMGRFSTASQFSDVACPVTFPGTSS